MNPIARKHVIIVSETNQGHKPDYEATEDNWTLELFGSRHFKRDYTIRVMSKPAFCICENKDADQLRGNREADQHLSFCYKDSTIPLLSKSKISSF